MHPTPWKSPTATARSAFPIQCRATPVHGDETRLHLAFVPPLPATRGRHGLTLTACPRGAMHSRLARLGQLHGCTIRHSNYPLPQVLYPRDNGAFEALWFVIAYRTELTSVARELDGVA